MKTNKIQFIRFTGMAAGFSTLLLVIFTLTAGKVVGIPDNIGLTPQAYLPAVMYPPPFPEPPTSTVEAVLKITPTGGINASTYNTGAFIIENSPAGTARINQVVIDLRTAVLPDMVFDPFGTAGDLVAKDVTIDSSPLLVGYTGRIYSSPHDDGFDVLTLNFTDFDPGETVAFSVDVDPTSIRGVAAPGPAESGSVSGLELSGATITVNFSNSLTLTGHTLPLPASSSGSAALIRQNLSPQPIVTIENIPTTPASVSSTNQVINISGGPVWSTAVVQIIEGGLFTAGLPGGGFDIDPFEANSALQINTYRLPVDNTGLAAIPISLTRSLPEGGLNHILVYFEDYYTYPGTPSATMLLELTP